MGRVGQTVLVHILFLWYLRMDIESLFCLERVCFLTPGVFPAASLRWKGKNKSSEQVGLNVTGGIMMGQGRIFWETLPFIVQRSFTIHYRLMYLVSYFVLAKAKARLVNFFNSISRSLFLYSFTRTIIMKESRFHPKNSEKPYFSTV